MKRTLLSIFLVASAIVLNAQTPFEKAMKESLALLDSAKTSEAMQSVVSRFERIAMAETAKWEPLYYAAFTQINMSFSEKDGDKTSTPFAKPQGVLLLPTGGQIIMTLIGAPAAR